MTALRPEEDLSATIEIKAVGVEWAVYPQAMMIQLTVPFTQMRMAVMQMDSLSGSDPEEMLRNLMVDRLKKRPKKLMNQRADET
jgi:hypothetical protein